MFLASCVGLGQRYYSAESIEASVVDEQTGKPLEGVIVVANWKLMRGTVGGRVPVGSMMILETVTDAKGRFFFPAWGPLENTTDGHLEHEDPELLFFKPGYRLRGVENHYGVRYTDKPSRRKSDWNGKMIQLKAFSGTAGEYAEHVADRSSSLYFSLEWNRECNFKKTPLLAKAFDTENTAMRVRGLTKRGFVFGDLLPEYAGRCGIARSRERPK